MNTRTLLRELIAEFIGTFALCFIGIGAIHHFSGAPGGLLAIAFAHGLTIAVFASAFGAISGGQFNPAVSLALLVGGKMDLNKAIAYILAQLAGAAAGAWFARGLLGSYSAVSDGTPDLGGPTGEIQGICIEAVLTFFLVTVIYGTAVDKRAPQIGGLAIGLCVTLDILFGGPLTGAAMNPARVFGPALVSGHWSHHYVYWAGPMLGGLLGGLVYGRFLIRDN
jgi:MIP family channel proteins